MITHAYADVNDIRLHYASEGSGSLILFLHGFPEFWYEWRNLLPEFGKDYLAVALDMRGYNLSGKPPELKQYQMAYLVEDIRAFAEHLGYSRFTLVAHDWGGIVAWNFAMVHPAMLDKLVIINAPHPTIFDRELKHNPAQQKASSYSQMCRDSRAETILSAKNYTRLMQMVFGNNLFGSDEEKQAYLTAWSQPGALTGGLNYYREMTGQNSLKKSFFTLDSISPMVNVPTLVIWGENDTALVINNLDGLDQYVPDLVIKRIPEGTHWVIHEQPQTIIGFVREFLDT